MVWVGKTPTIELWCRREAVATMLPAREAHVATPPLPASATAVVVEVRSRRRLHTAAAAAAGSRPAAGSGSAASRRLREGRRRGRRGSPLQIAVAPPGLSPLLLNLTKAGI